MLIVSRAVQIEPNAGHPASSQLPCIAEGKRRNAAGVFVQDQAARDRRLGALAAILAFAQPAVDADRRALRLLEIDSGGVNQPRRMTNFTTEPDCKARLRLRV